MFTGKYVTPPQKKGYEPNTTENKLETFDYMYSASAQLIVFVWRGFILTVKYWSF